MRARQAPMPAALIHSRVVRANWAASRATAQIGGYLRTGRGPAAGAGRDRNAGSPSWLSMPSMGCVPMASLAWLSGTEQPALAQSVSLLASAADAAQCMPQLRPDAGSGPGRHRADG